MEIIDIKTMFGTWPKRKIDLGPQELVAALRAAGISRAITCASSAILYDGRSGNEETWQASSQCPELVPAATWDPRSYLAAEQPIARLQEMGMRIFRFHNRLQGYSLELYCVRKMLAELAKLKMPCIFDAVSLEDACRIARFSQEFDLDVICTGLGYSFEAEAIALAQDFPRFYCDAGRLTGPDGIALFCRHVGSHRLVYGSDYPFDAIEPSLFLLQQADISERERERIAATNIKELLRL